MHCKNESMLDFCHTEGSKSWLLSRFCMTLKSSQRSTKNQLDSKIRSSSEHDVEVQTIWHFDHRQLWGASIFLLCRLKMAVSIRKIQNIPGVRVESLCISLQASKIFPGAVSKHPVRKNALKWLQRTWQTWFISMLRKCSPQEESITWLLSLGRTRRSK